ncbi:sperm microtubule associated protein 2-like isoform X1 [Mytilus edulis]|uniref:sperm microtubule associated protein 2-like isoform X1 n=1 Tax=Mytilus edulis TaxID=6550 RepID=UPI0039EE5F7C
MSEIAATPTTFPPIDRGHKHVESEQPKKRRSKSKKLPQIEHYKTFKPPERDYRDTELEKFSTFINSYAEERRIETLAKPKRVPSEFQDDRRSVYWIESNPPTPGPNGVTVIVATKRVSELAQHRVPHQYKHDRPSPIWPVRQTALEQEASERINQLSMHKNAHPQHAYDRTAYIEVSPGAKRAASTERIEMLSRPKMRQDRFGMDETEWGQYFPVSDAAKKATASGRIESLAESKRYHAMFQNEKPVQWPVDDGAMKAIASLEIQKLARPRSRTMIKDDYDPYKVPMAARRARATPRLDELCVPLPRKSRAKKAA